ncbi:hypothetical protein KSP39_PZI007355 [Platanthera zijinensis]|uniref:Uncharacterized protein n=1 Tax=Platanthera zijinensis TaxID=2320716 RepID=A0AAP0BQT9_9ASPA
MDMCVRPARARAANARLPSSRRSLACRRHFHRPRLLRLPLLSDNLPGSPVGGGHVHHFRKIGYLVDRNKTMSFVNSRSNQAQLPTQLLKKAIKGTRLSFEDKLPKRLETSLRFFRREHVT